MLSQRDTLWTSISSHISSLYQFHSLWTFFHLMKSLFNINFLLCISLVTNKQYCNKNANVALSTSFNNSFSWCRGIHLTGTCGNGLGLSHHMFHCVWESPPTHTHTHIHALHCVFKLSVHGNLPTASQWHHSEIEKHDLKLLPSELNKFILTRKELTDTLYQLHSMCTYDYSCV
jgi:hypothetical protein